MVRAVLELLVQALLHDLRRGLIHAGRGAADDALGPEVAVIEAAIRVEAALEVALPHLQGLFVGGGALLLKVDEALDGEAGFQPLEFVLGRLSFPLPLSEHVPGGIGGSHGGDGLVAGLLQVLGRGGSGLPLLRGDVVLSAGLVVLLRGKEDALEFNLGVLGPFVAILGSLVGLFDFAPHAGELGLRHCQLLLDLVHLNLEILVGLRELLDLGRHTFGVVFENVARHGGGTAPARRTHCLSVGILIRVGVDGGGFLIVALVRSFENALGGFTGFLLVLSIRLGWDEDGLGFIPGVLVL
mmetsp:Transcript_27365/g.51894  ORF Transcript_27365/g.51894 Transcript_27365/m.51894 type:complete len:298 (+) Transcript_27365:171-1064(+)